MIGTIIRGAVASLLAAAAIAASLVTAHGQDSLDWAATGGSLSGHLLVASPDLTDPNFQRSVVFLVQHDRNGAMGLVINRVIATGPIGKLLDGFGFDGSDEVDGHEVRVHYGGPVDPGASFVLHSRDYHSSGTMDVKGGVAVTGSSEVLRDVAAGRGPARSLLALGYAGWGAGQLEREITTGSWIVVDADPAILFDDHAETKWQRALARRGIDM
jgi:putative transcriptional regulator